MIRLKTTISVFDKFLSLNNILGVMINSLVNFKIIILLKSKMIVDFFFNLLKMAKLSLEHYFKSCL